MSLKKPKAQTLNTGDVRAHGVGRWKDQLSDPAPDLKLLIIDCRVKASYLGDGTRRCEISRQRRGTHQYPSN